MTHKKENNRRTVLVLGGLRVGRLSHVLSILDSDTVSPIMVKNCGEVNAMTFVVLRRWGKKESKKIAVTYCMACVYQYIPTS